MALSTTLSQTLPGPLPALDGEREDGGWLFGLWPFACREQRARAVPRCAGIPARALPQPSLRPPRSVALALSAGPPRFPSPRLAPPPGAERPPPPPMGPPPGPGSWQPAGGSLSMLHLFIDRALPQLLFQSPASCRRLIREGGAGSRAQSCHPGLGGNTESPPASRLPFLSPECSAIARSWEPGKGRWSDAPRPLEGSWACGSRASRLLLRRGGPGGPEPDEAPPPHSAVPAQPWPEGAPEQRGPCPTTFPRADSRLGRPPPWHAAGAQGSGARADAADHL